MTQEIIGWQDKSGLELAIAVWLDSKAGRSHSKNTALNYRDHLSDFRRTLLQANLDLDSDPAKVATIAQAWAGFSAKGQIIQSATYNKRLAIISSFYAFARKRGYIKEDNPISRIERRSVQPYAGVHWLTPQEGKVKLAAIDRTTLAGKRDFALLSVGIQTGRRLSELAGLRWGDLRQGADGKLTLHWRRTKGGKTTSDVLIPGVARSVMDWLTAYYTAPRLATLPKDAPVWVSLSPRNKGEALGIQTVADICEKRLGVSKVHTLRHTFARAMEDAGAKISTIQSRLGHQSLATTGHYLAAMHRAENEHAAQLADMFGLED